MTNPPNHNPSDQDGESHTHTEADTDGQNHPISPWLAGLAGVVAGAFALAVGELTSSMYSPRPGPLVSVANRVIDNAPGWFVEFGKAVFSLNDKPALVVGTILISLASAAGLGVWSRRRLWIGFAGIAGFGVAGMLAIAYDAQGGWGLALPVNLTATLSGMLALWLLMGRLRSNPSGAAPSAGGVSPSRRQFITGIGSFGLATAVSVIAADFVRKRATVAAARDAVSLQPPRNTVVQSTTSTTAGGASRTPFGPIADTVGISPSIVPNDKFYLIDTAVQVPQVDPNDWELTIDGMVDKPISISYQDLLDRSTHIETVTLSCVSNEVGGSLVGNAIWQGVPLTELLDEAGVDPDASQIASWSRDGWSCGFPTDVAYDGRSAMVAVGMNGEPLPIRHGFPARLVVSGLYGYVSATKWLERIELTTLDAFDGYWINKGWSKFGPVKLQSRIDTPRTGDSVAAGTKIPIAGVAWAPSVGIKSVEVRVGDGPWQQADLGESLGVHAWRQWRLGWTPDEGRHIITVRAVSMNGETQTSEVAPPAPDGATGWHSIGVSAL